MHDNNQQKLDGMIKAYSAIVGRKMPIELEMRAVIPAAAYRQLYDKLDKSTIVTEQSLNLTRSLPAQNGQRATKRRTVLYRNGKSLPGQTMMRKTTVKTEDLMHGFRIGLAIEEPLPPNEDIGVVDTLRFRHRISCMWVPNWQLDLTMVWQLTGNMMPKILALRDEFFDPARAAILAPDWPPPSTGVYTYEVEVEYKGEPAALTIETLRQQFDKLLRYVAPGTIDREYNTSVARLAERINPERVRPTLKDISNNPRIFTKAEYAEKIYPTLEAAPFYLCEKTDGDRVWVVARAGQIHVVTGSAYEIQAQTASPSIDCVIDAEYNSGRYYAFDLLLVEGRSIVDSGYSKRLGLLDDQCRALAAAKFPIITKKQTLTTVANFTRDATAIMKAAHATLIDGLIFSRADADYYSNVYKWKPLSHQTADFLIISGAPLHGIDPWHTRPGFTLYILFCSANIPSMRQYNIERIRYYKELLRGIPYNEQSFPIQFQHASNQHAYMYYHPAGHKITDLHGHIGEFLYVVASDAKAPDASGAPGAWVLQRMRPDRDIGVRQGTSYGNGLTIADITYTNVVDPITLEDLSKPPPAAVQYFSAAKDDSIKPAVKFNAFVKAMNMRQFAGAKWLLDLCCGQGQDMFVYSGYGIANLVMVDRDAAALKELAERKASLTNPAFYKYSPAPDAAAIPSIFTYAVDVGEVLSRPAPRRQMDLGKHSGQKYGAVVMNFAIHYFCGSTEQIEALIDIVDSKLELGGIFFWTAFGGRQVHHMLKTGSPAAADEPAQWRIEENGTLKYNIVRKYADPALTPAGQMISVKLPFANEAKDEYLVNFEYIVSRFQARGYQLRQNASFGNWFGAWTSPDAQAMAKRLTDADRQFCSLYQYASVIKMP